MVEASTSGKGVVRLLREENVDAILVHPDALMLTLRKNKNDQADAVHLAVVGQVGAAHEAYLPTSYEDALRTLTRKRYDLTERRTSLICQAHAVLARNLVKPPTDSPSSKLARKKWLEVELPASERIVLSSTLREMEFVENEISEIKLEVQRATRDDQIIRRLLTIPGMDVANAATLRGEFGDMTRFPSGKHAASYAGIVPPNWQSGEKEMHGHITKKGSPYLRHALIETVHQTTRYDSKLRNWYLQLEERIGTRKAMVAAARKLCHIAWAMTTKGTSYESEDKDLTDVKHWRHNRINELLDDGEEDRAKRLLNTHDARRARNADRRRRENEDKRGPLPGERGDGVGRLGEPGDS